jgi:Fe-S-cluster containining protein
MAAATKPNAWSRAPERQRLLELYGRAEALLSGHACPSSTECCRFGVSGREPYVTRAEAEEVALGVRARGGARAIEGAKEDDRFDQSAAASGHGSSRVASGKASLRLPTLEGRCPFLSQRGRCVIYAHRPLGCRTYFCERASGGPLPRRELQRFARDVAALGTQLHPADGPRPFTSVAEEILAGRMRT